MGNKAAKKDNFILQAGILAAAGIISRLIGLLYRSPLTAVIGDEGNGYYNSAYTIYTIILLISSYSIPSAISKVIAQKLSVKEYRNAHRIFLCAMWYVLAVGGGASLLLFFGAGLFVSGPAVQVLRIFAPTIFLYGILGVLRGYFQAHRTMLQTSVSQILEQILNAIVSIGAAYLFIQMILPGFTTADYEEATQDILTTRATYGAMGSAVGTGAGVAIALLFMWGVYELNKKMIHRRVEHDSHPVDSYGTIFRNITSVVLPFVLSTAIYNLNTSLNQTLYINICTRVKKMEEVTAYTNYGIFSGKAVVISNIPVALASAMSSAVLPSVTAKIATGEYDQARAKVAQAVKTTMLLAIPAAVGIGVLARPITWLLFDQKSSIDAASMLLTTLAVSVVFYSLSTLTNSVLQAIGRVKVPIYNAAISLVVQTVVLLILLLFTDCGLYSLVIVSVLYAMMMCILNQIAIRKYLEYKQEWFRTFITPFVSAGFMGVFAYGTYHAICWCFGETEYLSRIQTCIALFPAILVGVMVYFILEIILKGVSESELRGIPKGYLLIKVAKKCHLLK